MTLLILEFSFVGVRNYVHQLLCVGAHVRSRADECASCSYTQVNKSSQNRTLIEFTGVFMISLMSALKHR